jgi:hypothetical protein
MRLSVTRRCLISLGILLSLTLMLAGAPTQAQTNPSPFLYPLYPAATAPGGPAFTLTVNGTGFVSGAVVNWNGSPRPTTFVSNSKVTAAITAADLAAAKTAQITVTNPPPGGGTSNAQNFQVTFPYDALTFQDSILPTNPSGTFVPRVLVGDFNGDGKPDVIELALVPAGDGRSYNSVIQLLLGNGDGTFQQPVTVDNPPTGISISDLEAADLNGDGKLDLVGYYGNNNSGGGGTFALLGNGDGTFQSRVESNLPQALSKISVIADVNGDGIPDLVGVCGGVCVALGNGDGTFRMSFTYSPPFGFGLIPAETLAVGDFHKSGKLDIVAAFDRPFFNNNEPVFYLVMLPGNGDGTFGPASLAATVGSVILDDLTVADFDHDGNFDLEAYYCARCFSADASTEAAMALFRGNGDGTFQPPLTLPGLPESLNESSAFNMQPTVLVPGDFNGDGNIDLAAQNVIILLGNATGPLNHSIVPIPNVAFATADFNGDGRLDLVGIDANQNVHVMLQTSVPDFVGSINDPAYQDVERGETATYTINVTSLNGFAGTIEFSASGLPPGATATLTPSSLVGPGVVTVTITTSRHTPNGSYLILVSGTSVGITHSGGITLNVGRNDERFEDFGGTITPAYQTVLPGASTTYQINIFPLNGFDDYVRLKVRGLPPRATATFNPEVITGGSGSSTLAITTANPTATATYNLTVIGEGGHRRHRNGMNLNVGPAGTDFTDYIGSITPLSQTVQAGGVTTFTANIQPIDGTGCVFLQVLGLPPATGGHFDRTTGICGAPASTVFTITTYPQTPPGTYILQFQGTTTGGFTHTRNVTLIVTP